MRYTVPTISDARKPYVDMIKSTLSEWEYIDIAATNGNDSSELSKALERHGNPTVEYAPGHGPAKVGQIGRWMTFLDHLDAASEEPLFVFEDDAVIVSDFTSKIEIHLPAVPKDADFFSLFIPRNRTREVYVEGRINPVYDIGDQVIVRAHQPYGGVAMVLYPKFRDRLKKLIAKDGIRRQFDDYIYEQSQMQNLTGYSIVPDYQDLVWIVSGLPSTVHDTVAYNA